MNWISEQHVNHYCRISGSPYKFAKNRANVVENRDNFWRIFYILL